MTYRGRFAPSPTGPLHFGSLVAAVASWVDARAAGGQWLVRIEDVDEGRTVTGAAEAILATLASFGMCSDGEVVWQSRRKNHYEEALARLREAGLTYACSCSRKEIADSGLRGIEGPIYPGTCRERPAPAGTPTAVRLSVTEPPIRFEDRVQGTIQQDVALEIGDFVLRRRDGLHAYQLAVVVDDALQGISDVVRGADLLWSTPRQVALQRLLGYPTPRYLHVPIATNERGEKLSKQTLAAPVNDGDMRTIAAALRFLGQPVPAAGDAAQMLNAAVLAWDPARIPRESRQAA